MRARVHAERTGQWRACAALSADPNQAYQAVHWQRMTQALTPPLTTVERPSHVPLSTPQYRADPSVPLSTIE